MEQRIDLNKKSLLAIPSGTAKIAMRIETRNKFSDDLMNYYNDYFLQRLGGHKDYLRKNFVLCLSVKFDVKTDPYSRIEFK